MSAEPTSGPNSYSWKLGTSIPAPAKPCVTSVWPGWLEENAASRGGSKSRRDAPEAGRAMG